jgi:hypothetical protein
MFVKMKQLEKSLAKVMRDPMISKEDKEVYKQSFKEEKQRLLEAYGKESK